VPEEALDREARFGTAASSAALPGQQRFGRTADGPRRSDERYKPAHAQKFEPRHARKTGPVDLVDSRAAPLIARPDGLFSDQVERIRRHVTSFSEKFTFNFLRTLQRTRRNRANLYVNGFAFAPSPVALDVRRVQ